MPCATRRGSANCPHSIARTSDISWYTKAALTRPHLREKGHFFVIYSDNATKRIGTHDLEETFFHEGTHASIQTTYLNSAAWKKAIALDNAYITNYARRTLKKTLQSERCLPTRSSITRSVFRQLIGRKLRLRSRIA